MTKEYIRQTLIALVLLVGTLAFVTLLFPYQGASDMVIEKSASDPELEREVRAVLSLAPEDVLTLTGMETPYSRWNILFSGDRGVGYAVMKNTDTGVVLLETGQGLPACHVLDKHGIPTSLMPDCLL